MFVLTEALVAWAVNGHPLPANIVYADLSSRLGYQDRLKGA